MDLHAVIKPCGGRCLQDTDANANARNSDGNISEAVREGFGRSTSLGKYQITIPFDEMAVAVSGCFTLIYYPLSLILLTNLPELITRSLTSFLERGKDWRVISLFL